HDPPVTKQAPFSSATTAVAGPSKVIERSVSTPTVNNAAGGFIRPRPASITYLPAQFTPTNKPRGTNVSGTRTATNFSAPAIPVNQPRGTSATITRSASAFFPSTMKYLPRGISASGSETRTAATVYPPVNPIN